tara:strand:- start:1107 stop:1631 length:525 start_codon:yes stop_codon:yes gene_type:complete
MFDINEQNIILLIIVFIIISQFDLKYVILFSIIFFLIIIYYHNSDQIIEVNNETETILNILKKYEKVNKIEYLQGLKLWSHFIILTNKLNNDHKSYEFDTAYKYLYKSIEHFKSLIITSQDPELKDNINKLYEEGYRILIKLSIKLNKEWTKNPNTNSKETLFGSPVPHNDGLL